MSRIHHTANRTGGIEAPRSTAKPQRSAASDGSGGVQAPSASRPRAGKDLAADRQRDRFDSGKHGNRVHHHRKHHVPMAHASGDTSPIPPDYQPSLVVGETVQSPTTQQVSTTFVVGSYTAVRR